MRFMSKVEINNRNGWIPGEFGWHRGRQVVSCSLLDPRVGVGTRDIQNFAVCSSWGSPRPTYHLHHGEKFARSLLSMRLVTIWRGVWSINLLTPNADDATRTSSGFQLTACDVV